MNSWNPSPVAVYTESDFGAIHAFTSTWPLNNAWWPRGPSGYTPALPSQDIKGTTMERHYPILRTCAWEISWFSSDWLSLVALTLRAHMRQYVLLWSSLSLFAPSSDVRFRLLLHSLWEVISFSRLAAVSGISICWNILRQLIMHARTHPPYPRHNI